MMGSWSSRVTETIVVHKGHGLPYSKGLMAQALSATALSQERSFELARLIETRLAERGQAEIDVEALHGLVEELARRWSPQQIDGWLKLTYPKRPEMQVSHESIYRTLYVQSRGGLRKELTRYLRQDLVGVVVGVVEQGDLVAGSFWFGCRPCRRSRAYCSDCA